jgi:putative FmdB family regulatory protein
MPYYDYRCGKGHVTEQRRTMGCSEIVCPSCSGVAHRQAVYAEQAIRGDTVARPRLGNRATDKAGRFRLGLFQEAHAEILHDSEKAGIEPPDTLSIGKERAKRIQAAQRR